MSPLPRMMQAVAVTAYGEKLKVIEVRVPQPDSNEVLVQVHASGLCSTDTHLLTGRQPLGDLPRILGHELAGDIVELGSSVKGWQVGDRVTASVDVVCGSCQHCRTGQTQRCANMERIGFERDGGHSEYVTVPISNLVRFSKRVSYEQAAILPDAVACTYHCLVGQGKLAFGQTVVILGVGGLGIHGVQIAVHAGAKVIATSRRPDRLDVAEKFGAIPVNPNQQSLVELVHEVTSGQGADLVMDNIGNSASIDQGFNIMRPGGKFLVVAYLDEYFKVASMPLFSKEFELIGCRGSTLQDLVDVVRLVENGVIHPVIGEYFELQEIDQAVHCLENSQMIGRIVLTRKGHDKQGELN